VSELVEVYAARAVLLLREAWQDGYFTNSSHRKQLDNEDDLALLRSREDFRELRNSIHELGQTR
jgi:hypothetical protein